MIISGVGQLTIDGVARSEVEYKISEKSGFGHLFGDAELLIDAWSSQNVTLTLKDETTPTEIIVVSHNGGGQAEMTFRTISRH